MSKIIGKRQLVLATLVLALGAAVFVNWYYTKPEINEGVNASGNETTVQVDGDALGEGQYVNKNSKSNGESDEYFATVKLNRSAAHDEAIQTIKDMANAVDSEDAARAASVSIEKLSNLIKQESDIEALVTAKTGSECVAVINNDKIEVVVDKSVINDSTVLQITEIVLKNSDISSENITIMGTK